MNKVALYSHFSIRIMESSSVNMNELKMWQVGAGGGGECRKKEENKDEIFSSLLDSADRKYSNFK